MKNKILIGSASFFVLVCLVLAAQDNCAVKVPGALTFSEFKGYEAWRAIVISYNHQPIAVILGNPMMIDAYRAGFPVMASRSRTAPRWQKLIGCGVRLGRRLRHVQAGYFG